MRIGGRERGEPDQEEDRGWVYRNCGGKRVSVCGIREDPGVGIFELLRDVFIREF